MSTKPAGAGRLVLQNVLGYHLRRAQLRFFAAFSAAMGELPLTPMLVGTLMIVAENPGINQSDIAVALGTDRSTMVRLVDQLEGLGFVVRRPDPDDRRSSVPTLTDEGRRQLEEALPRIAASEDEIVSSLDPHEREQLLDLLRRINS